VEKIMSIKSLTPGRMRPAEASWRTYGVLVESHVPSESILEPGFWCHVAAKLRPLDRLEVMDDAGTWLAVLLVRAVGRREASVALLWSAELRPEIAPSAQGDEAIKPRWGGFKHKWTVVQGDTMLRQGMGSREEAEIWIRSHLKALEA
jgi:hypothetical protein